MPYGISKIACILAVLLSFSCYSPVSQNESPEIKPDVSPTAQSLRHETQISPGKINFKGISFNYDPQIFAEIEPEEVGETPLEDATFKPGGEFPNHASFKIKIANQKREAVLKILSIEDYKRMYAVWGNKHEEFIGNRVADLQKVTKDTNFRRNGEIPYVPYYDAHQAFQAKVKKISFQNGQGIIFLTQINQESLLVNNEMISYDFQGITNDGKIYIWATFPATVSFLPDNSDSEKFEDYNLLVKNRLNIKRFDEYIAKITKRLEQLPPAEFQPNLKYYEELISSLKIEN